MDLRELAQEATEQRHAAEAALDELRARERAMRARIAAERAAAAQMAAQRALSAQSALERAQAELAAAERAAAERAQLAHSIAERAAQAVAMAERAQRELGRAERSLADLEGGGGDGQSAGGEEESADADPDPDPDPGAVAAPPAPDVQAAAPLAEPDVAHEEIASPAARSDDPALPVPASPAPERRRSRMHGVWRTMLLFPMGLGAGLGVFWAVDAIDPEDPARRQRLNSAPRLELASTGEAAASTLRATPPATPLPEPTLAEPTSLPEPAPRPEPAPPPVLPAPPPVETAAREARQAAPQVAPPPAKPVREPPVAWIRNAVPSAPWDGRPLVALVLEGRDTPAPGAAVLSIGAPLTLVFSSDADVALADARRARRAGHELIAALPAAGGSAERVLDPELDTPELKQRLARNLERMKGFVGVRLPVSGGLADDAPRLSIVLRELARRGLLLVDTDSGTSAAAAFALTLDTPLVVRDLELSADASPDQLGRDLARLERLAGEQGSAVAAARASTAVMKAIERWLPLAASRGLRIVPLSAVVRHRAAPAR
jgi:polysaccharide deacetylase 2 family uncharacterized protein YibQ